MVADEPKTPLGVELVAIVGHDARRFLPPVLEGVQAECGQSRGIGVIEDAEYAAFLMQLIAVEVQSSGLLGAHARNRVQPCFLHRSSPAQRQEQVLL